MIQDIFPSVYDVSYNPGPPEDDSVICMLKRGACFLTEEGLFPLYAATMVKDSTFSAAFAWWLLMYVEVFRTRGAALGRWKFAVLFALATLLCFATKKTGIYVTVPGMVLMLFAYRRYWKQLVVDIVVPVALFLGLVPAVVYPALGGVEPGGNDEPTKTKDGKANYTAEFQNPAFEAQTKEDVVLPATGTEEDKIIEDLQNQLEDLARQIEELKEQLKHNPGWELVDDNWYYYDQNRQMVKGWVKVNNVWYFMDKETGIMQTGWVKDGDVWYYMKSSGAMAVGWIQVGDSWYYMKDNGAMAVGWIQVGDTWYYMKDNGAMAVGWIQVGDTWYYMKDNGAMAVGWIQDGETWYYMKSSGAMAASEWVAGYYWLSSSGAWTYQPVGSWQKNNQGWWFGDTSGWYAKNETVRISDVWYEFDAAGYWAQ